MSKKESEQINFKFGAHSMASRLVSEHAPVGKSSAVSLYWLFYYVGSSILGSVTGILNPVWLAGFCTYSIYPLGIRVNISSCSENHKPLKTGLLTNI